MSRSFPAYLLAATGLCTATTTVHADPAAVRSGPPGAVLSRPDLVAPSAEITRVRWYGWQVLAVDVASLASASALESGDLAIGGFLLGGPLVHIANGNHGRAAGSLAIRVGAPLAIGALASADCRDGDDGDDGWACLGSTYLGVLVGAAAASAVDAVWSIETVTEKPRITPTMQVADGAALVGLGGTF